MRKFLLPVLALALAGSPLASQGGRVFTDGSARHEFHPCTELLAAGYGPGFESKAAAAIRQAAARAGYSLHLALPPHRVLVFAAGDGAPGLQEAARMLVATTPARWARPAAWTGPDRNPESLHIITDDICIGLPPGADARRWAAARGARLLHSFARQGTHLLRLDPDPDLDPLAVCEAWQREPGVFFAHPDWLRPLPSRETIPNDPMFFQQWHLKNAGQGSGTPGADIRATFAWDLTTGDPGLVIAIIDSGVQPAHADLDLTPLGYNPLCGEGPLMGAPVPAGCAAGSYGGNHGTQVAGVAAGRINNGAGVAGVAGSCKVLPVNLLGPGLGFGSPSMEAMAFDYAVQAGAAVINNSWGPDGIPWPLPSVVEASFLHATSAGRGGLGTIIFWAGGNGNESIATDGYASSPLTIAVGASTHHDVRADYSDFGPGLDVVAPSSGSGAAIATTSTDSAGATLYTSSFGGTSAASPQGAGVAALMLSVNPALAWEQVRDILHSTAVKIDAGSLPGAPNTYDPATGRSPWYGYGRIDAHAAVLAAMSAEPAPLLGLATTGAGDAQIQISRAFPLGELYLPLSLQTHLPYGSGPVLGLGADALDWIALPLHTQPVHVLANAAGEYSFALPPGFLPPGLSIDMIGVAIQASPFEYRKSGIRRVTF